MHSTPGPYWIFLDNLDKESLFLFRKTNEALNYNPARSKSEIVCSRCSLKMSCFLSLLLLLFNMATATAKYRTQNQRRIFKCCFKNRLSPRFISANKEAANDKARGFYSCLSFVFWLHPPLGCSDVTFEGRCLKSHRGCFAAIMTHQNLIPRQRTKDSKRSLMIEHFLPSISVPNNKFVFLQGSHFIIFQRQIIKSCHPSYLMQQK